MGGLLRTVTIEQGHDPREFVLYAFGGAGATHAPAFALELVDEVLVPATQSVHSALGAIASDIALTLELAVPMRVAREDAGDSVDPERIEEIFVGLETQAQERLAAQEIPPERRRLTRLVEVRFRRQSKTLPIAWHGSAVELLQDFLRAYAVRYSEDAIPETAGFELVTFVIEARGLLSRPALARYEPGGGAEPVGSRPVYDPATGVFVDTPIYRGESLRPGLRLAGPAVVEYAGTTVALASGQTATMDELLGISIRAHRGGDDG